MTEIYHRSREGKMNLGLVRAEIHRNRVRFPGFWRRNSIILKIVAGILILITFFAWNISHVNHQCHGTALHIDEFKRDMLALDSEELR